MNYLILPSLLFVTFFVVRAIANHRWGAASKATTITQVLRKEFLLYASVAAATVQWFGIGVFMVPPYLCQVLACGVAVFGISVCYQARVARGRTWSRFGTKPPKRALTTHGVYRMSRHPYYLGITAFAWGVSFAFGNATMLLIALIWYLGARQAARAEELLCEREFGTAWRAYKEKTPFWFGVRRWIP